RDLRTELAAAQADQAGRMLVSAAQGLPSSRAGIELLVAGVGTGLRRQADLGAAAADRPTVLVQQTAQVSQQVAALAATTGSLTLRQAEQDRRALDAQLEFADRSEERRVGKGCMRGGAWREWRKNRGER